MNQVNVIGGVVTTPELKTTAGGKSVCSFRLGVNRPGKNATSDYFSIVCWDATAEAAAKFLEVGRQVAIEGRLHHNTWQAQDGSNRSTVEIVAGRVEFLGAPKAAKDEEAELPASDADTSEVDPLAAVV
jgi:single-strand DNA-binding protein